MSSPLTFDSTIVFINETFGLSIPTLPFLSTWMAPFTALWELLVSGSLPKPSQPLPWTIEMSGSWLVPVGGTVALQNVTITVAAAGENGSGGIGARLLRMAGSLRRAKPAGRKGKRKRSNTKGCRDPAL